MADTHIGNIGSRRPPRADESVLPPIPQAWAVLAAIANIRRTRAARALLQAERELRCARARQEEAEAEATRLRDRTQAIEHEWHRAQRGCTTLGLDLHRARTAQAQREQLTERQAERVRLDTQDSVRASGLLAQARARHGTLARKSERLRILSKRLERDGVK